MNRILAAVGGLLVFALVRARAQPAESNFAAVLIKPTTLNEYGKVEFKSGGRLTAINVTFYQFANAAYGRSWRLNTGPNCPKWIESEKFDVEAVAEEGRIPERLDNAQLRQRMQAMLQQLLTSGSNW